MARPLLQFPEIRAPHLEGHYYTYVRQFCAKHKISLEIEGINTEKPPRENDECIMDVACSDFDIEPKDCKKIYYCKSYLQIKWLSDLLTANAKVVQKGIWKGYRTITESSSKIEEAIQERPDERTWAVWRKFLKKHVCNNKQEAIIKLKGWKIDANTYERLWQFYYSEQYDCLYKSYRKEWHSGEHIVYEGYDGIGEGFFTFESSFERSDQLPLDAVPVSVEVIQTKGWYVPECSQNVYKRPEEKKYRDFMSYVATRPEYISQYYTSIEFYERPITERNEEGDVLSHDDSSKVM